MARRHVDVVPPKPPGRVEAKNSVSSSEDNAGKKSSAVVFSSPMFGRGPRLKDAVASRRPEVPHTDARPGRMEEHFQPVPREHGSTLDLRTVELGHGARRSEGSAT